MESEDKMILRDLPVDTRNYTILDNITGKPVEQNSYSLTIDPDVINKLNKLKQITEEKIRQASLKSTYSDATLVETFTPEDNSVFSPLYEGEYIDVADFNKTVVETTPEIIEEKVEEKSIHSPSEVITSDGLLDRVVARDPSTIVEEEKVETEENVDNLEGNEPAEGIQVESAPVVEENKTGLEQASEQIIKIDAEKLGPAIKPPKPEKPGREKISLDRMEVREGRGVAWMAYILFFIPLLFNRGNRFVRLHANSGLKLNLIEIFGGVLFGLQFVLKNVTGTLQTVVTLAGVLGLVLLATCAIILPITIIYAMFGGSFQVPWLWKKRMIYVNPTRE